MLILIEIYKSFNKKLSSKGERKNIKDYNWTSYLNQIVNKKTTIYTEIHQLLLFFLFILYNYDIYYLLHDKVKETTKDLYYQAYVLNI